MRHYTIVVMANLPMNNGEKEYSQECKAYLSGDEEFDAEDWIAVHYDSNNKISNEFVYPVMTKRFIYASSGQGAIFKFQKWQREGLDDKYLQSEEI